MFLYLLFLCISLFHTSFGERNISTTIELSLLFPSDQPTTDACSPYLDANNEGPGFNRSQIHYESSSVWIKSMSSLIDLSRNIEIKYSRQSKVSISSYGDPANDCFNVGTGLQSTSPVGRRWMKTFLPSVLGGSVAATNSADVVAAITLAAENLKWSVRDDDVARMIIAVVGNCHKVLSDDTTLQQGSICPYQHLSNPVSDLITSLQDRDIHAIIIVPSSTEKVSWEKVFDHQKSEGHVIGGEEEYVSVIAFNDSFMTSSPTRFFMNLIRQHHPEFLHEHHTEDDIAFHEGLRRSDSEDEQTTTTTAISGTSTSYQGPTHPAVIGAIFLGSAMAGVAGIGSAAMFAVRRRAIHKSRGDVDQIFVFMDEQDELFV